ncbi:MAG: molybdopterin molybdotransferase MoeA [Planctomycetes bacterium]|nr:molybdopterin molybdotransferase MoeA [Planctomycetota bacterium]
MLSVDEALAAILEHVRRLPRADTSLNEALDLVLAEAVASEVDSPPFDKALMDGYAVRSGDIAADGKAELRVVEELTAGRTPTRPVGRGEAVRIMTGAPLPDGADAVVRVEDTRFDEARGVVLVSTAGATPETNVLRRAAAMKAGDIVLPAGRRLRPQDIGTLAEMGRARVRVFPRPRVAVLATGDELVPVGESPGPGQIRNSNEPMLVAQIRRAGCEAVPLGIARDERTHLRERIEVGLECDVLLLSGGVSAGKLDLVPSELERAGVRPVFHKVHMKPGKPLWFGMRADASDADASGSSQTVVFGLPGNPVSSLVCFELFARTALRRMAGDEPAAPTIVRARLAEDHLVRGDRPTYHPCELHWEASGPVIRPVRWLGSADLRATVDANAMVVLPPGEHHYRAGDVLDAIAW